MYCLRVCSYFPPFVSFCASVFFSSHPRRCRVGTNFFSVPTTQRAKRSPLHASPGDFANLFWRLFVDKAIGIDRIMAAERPQLPRLPGSSGALAATLHRCRAVHPPPPLATAHQGSRGVVDPGIETRVVLANNFKAQFGIL